MHYFAHGSYDGGSWDCEAFPAISGLQDSLEVLDLWMVTGPMQ